MRLSQIDKLKFSRVSRGTRAVKRVMLPVVNTPGTYQPDQPELAAARARDGHEERAEIAVGIRALRPDEFETVLMRAAEYARARKVEVLDDRNPIYSLGYNLNLLAIACVDIDPVDDDGNPVQFDPENPRPWVGRPGDLDSAVEELRTSEHLTRDSIVYLAEQQEAWQNQVSPLATELPPEQLWKLVEEVATSGDASPFLRLRLGTQLQCMRFLAALSLNALTLSSPSDSASSESSSNGSSATDQPSKA